MQERSNRRAAEPQEIERYLNTETSVERVRLLESWQKAGTEVPTFIVKALLELNVPDDEVILAFDNCTPKNKADFELWLMDEFLSWNQNIAAAGLRCWARVTDCILWHRLIPVISIPELPQRIRYTILEIAHRTHGFEIVRNTINTSGWEDLSSAFHALLFERALQYDIKSERLISLAKKILGGIAHLPHPEHKAMFTAYSYLLRFKEADAISIISKADGSIWCQLFKTAHEHHSRRKNLFSKLEKTAAKDPQHMESALEQLPIWSRADAPIELLVNILNTMSPSFHTLAGFANSVIAEAYKLTTNDNWMRFAMTRQPYSSTEVIKLNASDLLVNSYNKVKFPDLDEIRSKACSGKLTISSKNIASVELFHDKSAKFDSEPQHPINSFLGAVRTNSYTEKDSEHVWNALGKAWCHPEARDLNKLSTLCRKHKGLAHLAFIKILAKMIGRDDAILKLLDYIRTDDETQLRAVVKALGTINTPRSHLELISMLTRANSTLHIQMDIVSILNRIELTNLQKELRSAIQDLKPPQNLEHPINQVRDELSGLIKPTAEIKENTRTSPVTALGIENLNLDQELTGMIPHYKNLSSEVKRALRTALFFNKTATASEHSNSIDLSPVIDMQYKAMELLYRELFEDLVSQSLQSGSIQRKLDVLGYARPIVRQMDEFEGYIASLPVVRDIPFFSKFKLRKMLRAICQFEPGRRFTLDGLKAFGLYFLIFGRLSCKAGLSGTIFVGTSNDLELAEFCKELHIFQDFRNRAAHEGFHPDASNDIAGIWRSSASIVQWAFKIKNAQKSATLSDSKKAS